jgi:hypothetical protein
VSESLDSVLVKQSPHQLLTYPLEAIPCCCNSLTYFQRFVLKILSLFIMFPYKNNVIPNENAVYISGEYENYSLL